MSSSNDDIRLPTNRVWFREEKRGVAILRPEHYDDWLGSKNPEFARVLIELRSAVELRTYLVPKQGGGKDDVADADGVSPQSQTTSQASLF